MTDEAGTPEVAHSDSVAPAESEARRVSAFISRTRVNHWTAEVVAAFRDHGIRAVLLKGPVVARWLYSTDSIARNYIDVDLLVAPTDVQRAQEVLRGIGFAPPLDLEPLMGHARAWIRSADGAAVDLHRTLHGMEAIPTDRVWAAVVAEAETCLVGGLRVEIPGPVMRTLHVVLHIAPTEDPRSQASEDLRRAITQIDQETWKAAANLAGRLGVEGEVGQRLHMTVQGAVLANQLGLGSTGSLLTQVLLGMDRSELPRSAYYFWCLASGGIPTFRDKVRWILHHRFPPRRYMEERYSLARRGNVGLTASYVARVVVSCARLPSDTLKWVRFTKRLRGQSKAVR